MKSSEFTNILKKLNKNNIAFIGHMGSGKSVIGKILSKQLDIKHIDSDAEIIKYTNKSIYKIFQEEGEEYFRSIEKKIVLNLYFETSQISLFIFSSIYFKLFFKS